MTGQRRRDGRQPLGRQQGGRAHRHPRDVPGSGGQGGTTNPTGVFKYAKPGSCFGFKPTPSLKIATNTPMYRRMEEDMDLEDGRGGLAKDEAEAVRWFRKAAEQGNAAAKFRLARLGLAG